MLLGLNGVARGQEAYAKSPHPQSSTVSGKLRKVSELWSPAAATTASTHFLSCMLPSPSKSDARASPHTDQQHNSMVHALSRDPLWALAVRMSSDRPSRASTRASSAERDYDDRVMMQLAVLLDDDSDDLEEPSSSGSSQSDLDNLYVLASLDARPVSW